jgi:ankyrin repeat protein
MSRKTNGPTGQRLSAALRIALIMIAVGGFIEATALQIAPQNPAVLAEQLRCEARQGNVPQLDALLSQGVPVDQPDAYGITALIEASRTGKDEAVEHLLRAGANVNACAPVFSTGLMQATINRHPSTVAILLRHGASPNLRAVESNSALFWAIEFQEPAIIRLLERYGGRSVHV